ncbi:mechanosensitive ion channel family protein [Yunchengibacter salinarum]|uniref:mechanosensitive ion channel family protein n=1 Tax=Yunchengibacter salinarum TaxID=3133399 RepID=UPI0035B5F729
MPELAILTQTRLPWDTIGASAALIVLVILVRSLFHRVWVNRVQPTVAARRRSRLTTRASATAIILIGLVLLWAPQLQTFALSLAAFAVAIVLASKELILNMLGGFYRVTGRAFHTGDWIRVGDTRGEVVETRFMTTEIEELEGSRYTGRRLFMPNAMMLTHTLVNETGTGEYVRHFLEFVLPVDCQWRAAQATLQQAIDDVVDRTSPRFQRFYKGMERSLDIERAAIRPYTGIAPTRDGWLVLRASVFLPLDDMTDLENEINQKVTEAAFPERGAASSDLGRNANRAPAPERAGNATRKP